MGVGGLGWFDFVISNDGGLANLNKVFTIQLGIHCDFTDYEQFL